MTEDIYNELRCSNPKLVKKHDIEIYVEGKGRPEFVKHLGSCDFCQEEVQKSKTLDNFLTVKLGQDNREGCISLEQLQDYTMGWLKGRENSRITTHLKNCPFCWLEQTQLQAELAVQLVGTEPFLKDNILQRVIAVLQPRSKTPQLLALRGEEADGGLVYRFEDVTVLLNFEPDLSARNKFTLTGTVTLPTPNPSRFVGSRAILKQGETEVVQEEIEASGDFFLAGLTSNKMLKLEIHLTDLIIEIPELPVS